MSDKMEGELPAGDEAIGQDLEFGDPEAKTVNDKPLDDADVTKEEKGEQDAVVEVGDVSDASVREELDENGNKKVLSKAKLLDQIMEMKAAEECLKRVMSIPLENIPLNLTEDQAREHAETIISDMEDDLIEFLRFWGVVRETPNGPQRIFI